MKALITFNYNQEEIKMFEALGYEVILHDERNLIFTDDIKDADIMVCFNPFDKIDLNLFTNLKWIQLLSAGVNQVPREKVLSKEIMVTNHRGGYSVPIAEWIVLKILEMAKNSKEFHKLQDDKNWKMDTSLIEIYKKTIGFIGTGDIAKEAAKRLEGFGVNIIGFNFSGNPIEHFHKCYSIDKINTLIHQCDFVVIAAPGTDETYHLIDEEVFNHMKDGTYLVNIARGNIINENILIENLKSGKIKKAALDVFETEPLHKDSPLWEMNNVIISPHNSWASEMNHRRRFEAAYNNMKRYINGEKPINIIDLNKGY